MEQGVSTTEQLCQSATDARIQQACKGGEAKTLRGGEAKLMRNEYTGRAVNRSSDGFMGVPVALLNSLLMFGVPGFSEA
jgi:hypothetical protein